MDKTKIERIIKKTDEYKIIIYPIIFFIYFLLYFNNYITSLYNYEELFKQLINKKYIIYIHVKIYLLLMI